MSGTKTNVEKDAQKIRIKPCSLAEANEYVKQHHRHHGPTTGHKFSIKAVKSGETVGVAICGRPVSRFLDDGQTLEINRLCTNGTNNACSMLYGACSRIAKEMGYKKIITYTLASEAGASLKASNFVCDGEAGKEMWTGKRSSRDNGVPKEKKLRWSKTFCNKTKGGDAK